MLSLMGRGKFVKRINQVIQVSTDVLSDFSNLFNAIKNVDGLRVRIVTNGKGTLQVAGCPFTDFFLRRAEGIGNKVERLEGSNRVRLSSSLFRVKRNLLRLLT